MLAIRLSLALLLALLPPVEAFAQYRPLLTGDLTYFVRSDGSDSNDCLSDSAGGACLTWQHPVDLAAAWDINRYTITIRHGVESSPKTFTANTSIPAMTGGGGLKLFGSATPGYTIINVAGDDCFTLNGVGTTQVLFGQMKLVGGGAAQINVAGNSVAIIGGGMDFGAANWVHVFVHDSQALLYVLNSSYTVSGSAPQSHIFVNGGMAFHENSPITITGTPSFPGAFLAATNAGKIQVTSAFHSGSIIGPSCAAQANAVINTYGGGWKLPGTACVTATGGQYIP